ncbi:fumarylacetoacetate hydrolase family protein [Archangium minus]|uniref:Fumarylacetoacetate hydrolase family protein n=1 Tax=Archangium minus TaxID=83450 RepID=A0ABY9X8D0_9BACT|nr:fumarylacetoacetate hydrolase family protein [Archangium minus]
MGRSAHPGGQGRAPWQFLKSASCVVGPGAEIPLPAYSRSVDWEAEIAVVIGMPARDVPVERAMEHVAGFTIINDLSARDFLKRANVPAGSPFAYDWLSQKCFDGACPMGPWLTPRERIPDPDDMKIELWVNDCLKQDSTSRNLIFTAAEQVAYLSTRLTLRPGDVIATGTPAGVGMARGEFLKPGDEVRIRIGGIGELRHRMV